MILNTCRNCVPPYLRGSYFWVLFAFPIAICLHLFTGELLLPSFVHWGITFAFICSLGDYVCLHLLTGGLLLPSSVHWWITLGRECGMLQSKSTAVRFSQHSSHGEGDWTTGFLPGVGDWITYGEILMLEMILKTR